MSEKLELSDLKLVGISVLKSTFERNVSIDFKTWEKDNDSYKFGVVPSLAGVKGDPNSARIILEASLFTPQYEAENEPFYIDVKTAFYFKDTAKYENEDNIVSRYGANMVSMAFPYVRSYLQTITALSGITSVTVPPINVFELFKDMAKNSNKKWSL